MKNNITAFVLLAILLTYFGFMLSLMGEVTVQIKETINHYYGVDENGK